MKRAREKSSTAASRRGYIKRENQRSGEVVYEKRSTYDKRHGTNGRPSIRSAKATLDFQSDPERYSKAGESMVRSNNPRTRLKGEQHIRAAAEDADAENQRSRRWKRFWQRDTFKTKKVKIKRKDGVVQTYHVTRKR